MNVQLWWDWTGGLTKFFLLQGNWTESISCQMVLNVASPEIDSRARVSEACLLPAHSKGTGSAVVTSSTEPNAGPGEVSGDWVGRRGLALSPR